MVAVIGELYKYPIIQVREINNPYNTSKYDICIWVNSNEPIELAKGWWIAKLDSPMLDRNNQVFIPYQPFGWGAKQKVKDYINNKYQTKVIELGKEPYYCSDVSELPLLKDWEKVYDSVS